MHVDDIVIIESFLTYIQEINIALGNEFAMKDPSQLNFFLGIEVTYFEGGIHLNQSNYICYKTDKED